MSSTRLASPRWTVGPPPQRRQVLLPHPARASCPGPETPAPQAGGRCWGHTLPGDAVMCAQPAQPAALGLLRPGPAAACQ